MKIVFAGTIGRSCVGGLAWMNMEYLAGLHELGHDVIYFEECGPESWVYDWDAERLTTDLSYPSGYLSECLEPLGLGERWIYRAGTQTVGMPLDAFLDACAHADLLIVLAQPLALWRSEYLWPTRRIFIDLDPGFTQMSLVGGHAELRETTARCQRLFSIAQRLDAPDCVIPFADRKWITTRPPVALSQWPIAGEPEPRPFTTVMQWRGFRDVEFNGCIFGQKDREFPRFLDLPRHTTQTLCLALTGAAPDEFVTHGWEVVPGWVSSRTPWSYRDFIAGSRAEFSVAKHGYVQMRGGWFSDRSVCYLASGRPVLVQDTGLADWLPVGEGVLTFNNLETAVLGIEAINENYEHQRRAARRIAEEYFAAELVLPPLLDAAMES